jgi:two-component system, chemotaxis family, protein-glutamate methylesterase/glutaminase
MHGLGGMPWRNLVVVGGSAGSLTPLTKLLQGLPASCPACLPIIVHSSSENADNLAHILSRTSRLPISIAAHNQPVVRGVFVAPPGHHLLVTPGYLHVTVGPKENGFRPAIDALFRTAAHAYGQRVIGVLLSGALADGVNGLREIKSRGGLTIVQAPDEAEVPSLPRHAIEHVDVDHVLTAAAMASLVTRRTVFQQQGQR